MACYAEIEYYDERNDFRRVLIRFDNKEERTYVMWRFENTAGPEERIRPLTRDAARRDYDIDRFGKLPYADIFLMANPDRPGTNWRFDAIEPTKVFAERQQGWRRGRGQGTQMTLIMDGEGY